MTIWSARNGYLGYSAVAALVEADTETEAREKASAALAAEVADNWVYNDAEKAQYAVIESIRPVKFPFVGDELP